MAKKKKFLTEWFDRFGNLIIPGDYVVYGNFASQSAQTAIGQVLQIAEVEAQYSWKRSKDITLQVASIQSHYDDTFYTKVVWLQIANRVLKYEKRNIPPHLVALLNPEPKVHVVQGPNLQNNS